MTAFLQSSIVFGGLALSFYNERPHIEHDPVWKQKLVIAMIIMVTKLVMVNLSHSFGQNRYLVLHESLSCAAVGLVGYSIIRDILSTRMLDWSDQNRGGIQKILLVSLAVAIPILVMNWLWNISEFESYDGAV